MAKRNERKRISRDKVRENAASGSKSSSDWFTLPEEIGKWIPDKAGRFSIDILPYEVKGKFHPDDIEPGCLWYKFPFAVHHGVGEQNQSVVCPTSIGKACPICEERNRLYKEDSDKYEDIIRSLKPQKFVAYNILDPEDSDRICLLAMSRGKLAAPLENELKDPDNEEHLAFFDVTKDGRTLRIRFTEESYEGKKYLEASKIDFVPRDEMDEDEILDKVVCLEEAVVVMPYDKLKAMFLQESGDNDDDDDDDADDADDKKPKGKSKPKDDDDDDVCVACGGTGYNSKGKPCPICNLKGNLKPKDDEPDDKPKTKAKSDKSATTPNGKAKPKDDDEKSKGKSKPKDDDDDDDDWDD